MRMNYTDGTIVDIPDMCAHCQMNTGGNHQAHCPLSWSYNPEIVINTKVTIQPQWETFNQTLKRIIKKHREMLDALSEFNKKCEK